MTETKEQFVISRTFDAPRALVWKAFSDASALAQWWGPKGFAIDVHGFDFRPGGHFHYRMHSAQGNEMWGRFVYREIVPQERVVVVNGFSDENGRTTRAPFSELCPLEILLSFTFADQGGGTLMTLTGEAINATAEEHGWFESMRGSMNAGFGNAFDQLAAYLSSNGAR